MSESKELQHALTDVCLENKAGMSSQVGFKLDTGLSGATWVSLLWNISWL